MLLADFGYEDLALKYIISIRSCTGIWDKEKGGDSTPSIQTSGNAPVTIYSSEFIAALKILEDRLCISMGVAPSWKRNKKSEGRGSYFGSMVKSYWAPKTKALDELQKEEFEVERLLPGNEVDSPIELSPKASFAKTTIEPKEVAHVMKTHEPTTKVFKVATATPADEGFILAKPSILNSTTKSTSTPADVLHSPFIDTPTKESECSIFSNKEKSTDSSQPSASAPPSFGENVADRAEELKPKNDTTSSLLSTPSQVSKREGKKAPVSEPPSEY